MEADLPIEPVPSTPPGEVPAPEHRAETEPPIEPVLPTLLERAARVQERIDALARISEDYDGVLTRTFGSEAMRRANALVGGWMREAGLRVEIDAISNLRGFEVSPFEDDTRPLLLLGSHLDTVREAGRFDGPLGVLAALSCAEAAFSTGGGRAYRLGIIGFSDEEGTRFQSSYLGSETLAGRPFPAERLALTDASGITLLEVIEDLGSDPAKLRAAALDQSPEARHGVAGYCEIHIEQGPVLEAENLPVGVVTAIAGQSRLAWEWTGQPGHAGTTPMRLRRDALSAAAEWILAAEDYARLHEGLVVTVGQLEVRPGASNVIPGRVSGSLDVRSPDDTQRTAAYATLHFLAEGIAARRGVSFSLRPVQEHDATPCDSGLRARMAEAVRACGFPVRELPSGAGHDAVALAPVMPVAMLFVRCRGGLSHHPDEFASVEDIAAALNVMDNFLLSDTIPPPLRHDDEAGHL